MNRKDIDALRMNGYRTDADGRIACRAGIVPRSYDPNSWRNVDTGSERFADTHLVAIVVDVLSGDGRAIVDSLITAADSPRAIVGKRRNGSAVLLFKCPAGMTGANRVEEFGSRDGSLRFTLSILSEGAAVDVAAYSWDKARSPLEFDHARLPVFTPDVATLVTAAAADECPPWSMVEQTRQDEADSARYATMRIPTAQEEREAEEERLVAAHEGEYVSAFDGGHALEILRARKAVAARRAARAEAQI
jgi:hypothetical protein